MSDNVVMTDRNLGLLLSEHLPTRKRQKGNLYGGVAATLLGIVVMLSGILMSAGDTRLAMICGLPGLITSAAGGWSLWQHRRDQDLAVRLFQDGITKTANSRRTSMSWDEISQVFLHFSYHRKLQTQTHLYRLVNEDGNTMTIQYSEDELDGLAQLGQTIQREVNGRLLPQVYRSVHAGQIVDFQKFSINLEGITSKRKHLPWADVAAVEMNNGWLNIWQRGQAKPWARIEVLHVPNIFVFRNFVNQMSISNRITYTR